MRGIQFIFNERKAAQAAARLIAHSGGEMNYLALMKLLYLVDREALLRFGRPITGDKVVAMKHGPVLSRVYDLVSHNKQHLPRSEWHDFIARPDSYVYTVKFSGALDISELSEAEVALLDEVFAAHREKSEWDLVDYTHSLPEWHDPKDTSVPISFESILKGAHKSGAEIAAIAEEAEADLAMETALASLR